MAHERQGKSWRSIHVDKMRLIPIIVILGIGFLCMKMNLTSVSDFIFAGHQFIFSDFNVENIFPIFKDDTEATKLLMLSVGSYFVMVIIYAMLRGLTTYGPWGRLVFATVYYYLLSVCIWFTGYTIAYYLKEFGNGKGFTFYIFFAFLLLISISLVKTIRSFNHMLNGPQYDKLDKQLVRGKLVPYLVIAIVVLAVLFDTKLAQMGEWVFYPVFLVDVDLWWVNVGLFIAAWIVYAFGKAIIELKYINLFTCSILAYLQSIVVLMFGKLHYILMIKILDVALNDLPLDARLGWMFVGVIVHFFIFIFAVSAMRSHYREVNSPPVVQRPAVTQQPVSHRPFPTRQPVSHHPVLGRQPVSHHRTADQRHVQTNQNAEIANKILSNVRDYRKQTHFAFDTNILMLCPEVLSEICKKYNVVLSKKVFDELDRMKTDEGRGFMARRALSAIENAQVEHPEKIKMVFVNRKFLEEHQLDPYSPDEMIIGAYLDQQKNKDLHIVFVTHDRGARIIARNAGLEVMEIV